MLVIKNVELWELALIAVSGAALLRGRRWVAAWSIAAAALVKMLPLVFIPYLLLRDRKTFGYTLVALAVLLSVSQAAYGTAIGWGYLPAIVNAAIGGDGYGNSLGLTWHENVSMRGIVDQGVRVSGAARLHDRTIRSIRAGSTCAWCRASSRRRALLASVAVAIGGLWVLLTLARRTRHAEPSRTYWDWALISIMMLVLAPQISQDYMVLSLGAFSFVLAGCMLFGTRAIWIEFAIAVLLVGNIVPRGVFSRSC